MMSREELAAWLHLIRTPGLGPAGGRRLLAAFGAPERVLGASRTALREVVGGAIADALLAPDARLAALVERTWRWLDAAPADAPRDAVVLGDPRYPTALLQTADPPLLIHTSGRVGLLSAASVAIVGSRNATPQGLANARGFARHLSGRGLTIVSGLALGIDGAAHEGGLAGPGSTIAFVGTGLDQVYPPRHAALAEKIARHGLMASEYPLGTEPLGANFPRRNRLIAGLARGTLVVEAALQSGSLITARMAMEAGREVFAIPGSIHSPQARGCHRLIQQGAKLVETGDDVVEELQMGDWSPGTAMESDVATDIGSASTDALSKTPSPASTDLDVTARCLAAPGLQAIDRPEDPDSEVGRDAALFDALGYDPVTFDALSARTGWQSDRLAAHLLDLELAGAVQRLPGGLLQRRGDA